MATMVILPVWLMLLFDLNNTLPPMALTTTLPLAETPCPAWFGLLPVTVSPVPPATRVTVPYSKTPAPVELVSPKIVIVLALRAPAL